MMKHLLLTTIAAVVLVVCGESSIQHAARYGNIEAVKQHVAAGTDINAHGGKYDGTALHEAAARGHKEIVELLIKEGADMHAKVNSGLEGGMTPLHWAAREGRKEVVELLISKGADVNTKDNYGNTPLDRAIQYKAPKEAALLRKHGGKTGEELKAEGK